MNAAGPRFAVRSPTVVFLCMLPALCLVGLQNGRPQAADRDDSVGFARVRPQRSCYPRPRDGEELDVSPPGFCWWRAAERGEARYRLTVTDAAGKTAYESPLLDDPAHLPPDVLPPGRYEWTFQAVDGAGELRDSTPARSFSITDNAVAQPWIPADELLARVPREHPRLLFPEAQLEEVRATLDTTRREAYQVLKRTADGSLDLTPPPEPTYDKIEDPTERRLAYIRAFSETRKYHDRGMVHLSLMYVLSGDRKYGEVAKEILLGATEWDLEGVSSVMGRYGDEVGLGLVGSCAQSYDWLYDLLSEDDRAAVKQVLIARGDQMLRRLQRIDFLTRPEDSHCGRLPGYLVEHAIALAEEPRAAVWLDYALCALTTCFPHWGGIDGGWAEGVAYGQAYNTIYLTPFESLRAATGFDLWQRPFYRKVRRFFMYNISPLGEISPWGDSEDGSIPARSGGLRALLQFHALRYRDPEARAWVELLRTSSGDAASISALPGLILPDDLEPGSLDDLPRDAAFRGVGWAALHSDLARPERDLCVLFKSSPYGGVSHSHADQNSFAIMYGGHALAIPGGSRYPQHGTPFHTKYTQQTIAHNAILVDGKGQINRDGNAGGELVDFRSTDHMGYVCGDAQVCYGDLLSRAKRHVLLVRPDVVFVVDDLQAPEPASFAWLMHAKEELDLDVEAQSMISTRGGASLAISLFTAGGFGFAQTDEWPMDPKEGFPTATKRPPAKQFHFTATTEQKAARRRIAAVMALSADGRAADVEVQRQGEGALVVTTRSREGSASVSISLDADAPGDGPIIRAEYTPAAGGEAEDLAVR